MKNFNLGNTTNLLYGYDPSWLSDNKGNNALYPSNSKAFEEISIKVPRETGKWNLPEISLHDNPESLLNFLLPYKIKNPSETLETAILPSGKLLIGDEDSKKALKQLSVTLGVDLEKENCGYALVQIKREDGQAVHPANKMDMLAYTIPTQIPEEFKITDEFKDAASKLKRFKKGETSFSPDNITVEDANGYLHFFETQGTHFISGIYFGDVIFQIFQMQEKQYWRVKNKYENHPDKLSGSDAILFTQYTTDCNSGAFGYVQQYGNILSFSQSETLKKSLEEKMWMEPTFAETQSIFAPYQWDTKITIDNLDKEYKDSTAILTELTSLTLFMEYSRRLVWERVFKGAIIQKYQTGIKPHFIHHNRYKLDKKFQRKGWPSILSDISTPVINLYQPEIDLSELQLTAPEVVKDFTLFSNSLLMTHNDIVEIPGKSGLICAQVVAFEDEFVPVIRLSGMEPEQLVFHSQHFYGALLIKDKSETKHCTITDGLKYVFTTGMYERPYVKVTEDVRCSKGEVQLKQPEKLADSLEYSYAFAEVNMNLQNQAEDILFKQFLRESFLWITQLIPQETEDIYLRELRVRALDMAYMDRESLLGTFVPVASETEYQKLVDKILIYIDEINQNIDKYQQKIEARKKEERDAEAAEKLNENIIKSGKLLHEYLRTVADKQKDLNAYYEGIINLKKGELSQQLKTIQRLWVDMNKQRPEVITAVENYKQAIKDWEITAEIKFGLCIASDIFSLGTSIMIPSSTISSVKALGNLAQMIQKLLNVMNNLNKLYEDLNLDPARLKDIDKKFEEFSDVITINFNWDELSIMLDTILSGAPSGSNVLQKKTELVSAFKIYVLKGKAYTSAQSAYNTNAKEVYLQQGKQRLMEKQTERLNKLDKDLNPATISKLPVERIDLIGLTGNLYATQSHILSMLTRSFLIRDHILQYVNLQTTASIPSFDTLGLRSALVNQQNNTIDAINKLGRYQESTTKPIPISVEIPVKALKDGDIYTFHLQPDHRDFFQYIDTKIHSVIAKVEGIKSTDSGLYFVKLCYKGSPFYNKGLDGNTLIFNTLERDRIYEYKVEKNDPQFKDKGISWSKDKTPVTPFSTWEISLPSDLNKGLVFEDMTVKVTLSFVLNARIFEKPRLLRSRSVSATSSMPSVATLLSQMQGKTILNNWDVVFNMSLENINEILKKQFDEFKANDKEYGGRVDAIYSTPGAVIGTIRTYNQCHFDFKYGYPQLEFLANSHDTARLLMQITTGMMEAGIKYLGDNTERNKMYLEMTAESAGLSPEAVKLKIIEGKEMLLLEFFNPKIILKQNTSFLQAIIQLKTMKGLVKENEKILSVSLDMEEGTFSAKNIEIEMDDMQKEAFSQAVKAYFSNHQVVFVINSIDLTDITTLPDLKPNQFLFKILKTQKGNDILQLFIQTKNRKVFDYSQTFISTDVPEPIPEGSKTSIMINSRLFFERILPQSSKNNLAIQGIPPKDISKSWKATFSLSLKSPIDLSAMNHIESVGYYSTIVVREYTYEPTGGNPVAFTLDSIEFNPSNEGKLQLEYNKQHTFYYDEKQKTTQTFSSRESKQTLHTDITLDVTASISITISGSDRNQGIEMIVNNKDANVSARTSGGGPCGCNDLDAQINKKLKDTLPDKMKDAVKIEFNNISVFILKNLLFPSGNYIKLTEAYIPGDFLIVGNFS